MNLKHTLIAFCATVFCLNAISQVTATDGDWSSYYVNMKNTPQADQMIRFGDVDNLGFGWGTLDPFKGDITPKHAFPWKRNINDTIGMDMVMVITSNTLSDAPALGKCNGYSTERQRLLDEFGKTNFELKIPMNLDKEIKIEKMMLQMFLTDVQAGRYNLQYKVYINGRRAEFMERTINQLDQSGEFGKLVSFNVPKEFFNEFTKAEVRFSMDDSISPQCEGFAIDFVKVLVNPVSTPSGEIKLIVKDKNTNNVITGAKIQMILQDREYTVDSKGELVLTGLTPGNYSFAATAEKYHPAGFFVDVDAENLVRIIYLSNTQSTDVPTTSQPPVMETGILKDLIKVVFSNRPSNGSGGNQPKTDKGQGPVKTDQPSTDYPSKTKTPPSTRRR